MADRFWVGGSGTWDASSTANWSATSGGAAGASAPTSADNVFFDAGSDAGGIFTVTIGTGAVCANITASGLDFTGTLNIPTSLNIYGNLTFPSVNWVTSGPGNQIISFNGMSPLIATNGVIINASVLFLNGGELNGDIRTNNVFQVQGNGVFNTNNYNITTGGGGFAIFGSPIFNAGSSIITSGGGGLYGVNIATTATFNPGTSTIDCTAQNPIFSGGGKTFYNVKFSNLTGFPSVTMRGINTFNNLEFTMSTAVRFKRIILDANQIVNGTLTLSGMFNDVNSRVRVHSNVHGTQRNIELNGTLSPMYDVDFTDISISGTYGTLSGTRIGDGGNNTNISFTPVRTVYLKAVDSVSWGSNSWALVSGGVVEWNNRPLAQDTVIIDDASIPSGKSLAYDTGWHIGNLDMSSRTLPMTFSYGVQSPQVFGDVIISPQITVSGSSGAFSMVGVNKTQQITTNGVQFGISAMDIPNGMLIITDNFVSYGGFTLTSGTLNVNNNNLTCTTFTSNNSNTRSIMFGTGRLYITGNNTSVFNVNSTGLSVSGSRDVYFTYSGSVGTRSINNVAAGGATESNCVNYYINSGSDTISTGITSTGVYNNIDFTGFSGTYSNGLRYVYGNMIFSPTMTLQSGTNTTFFTKSSGIQTVKTNGVIFDMPITKNGTGTLRLNDDLIMGNSRIFELTTRGLDLNNHKLSTTTFSSSNSNGRTIDFGDSGVLELGGSWNPTLTNLTIAGKGTINMTSATAKTFAGGGLTYGTLNQGGAGDLTITGANTFQDVTNSVYPCTVIFPANTTTYVKDFSLTGRQNDLVTVKSSVAGTRATITKV